VKLLLDTCTFLWVIVDPGRLSDHAQHLFCDAANPTFLSVVSGWEIAVKHRLGRLPLPTEPSSFIPAMRRAHGIADLPLDEDAALRVADLPDHHGDPFDRMLICQALYHDLVLLTPDAAITRYDVRVEW